MHRQRLLTNAGDYTSVRFMFALLRVSSDINGAGLQKHQRIKETDGQDRDSDDRQSRENIADQ